MFTSGSARGPVDADEGSSARRNDAEDARGPHVAVIRGMQLKGRKGRKTTVRHVRAGSRAGGGGRGGEGGTKRRIAERDGGEVLRSRDGTGEGTDGKGYTKVRWYIGFLLGVDQKKGSKKRRRRRRRRRKRMRWWQRRRFGREGDEGRRQVER